MRTIFSMRTIGYTHDFVKRQRYFTLEAVHYEVTTNERTYSHELSSGEEIQRAKDSICKAQRSVARYLAHEVYQFDAECNNHICLYLSIVDTTTGAEVLHVDKDQYVELVFSESVRLKLDIPHKLALISMSERGVKLLTDLTPASFWAIRNTQAMVKRLSVDPISPPTVKEILEMSILQSWLPDGTCFDLGRMPPEEYLKENPVPGRNYPRWECETIQNVHSKHRWVRYVNAEMTWRPDLVQSCIPQDAIPEDRSILMIPMRKLNARTIANCTDDFMMYVEIIYRAKPAASDSHDTGTLSEIKIF